ncbi:MAG: DUF255 domain-containing protein [Myxococcota bacterium]
MRIIPDSTEAARGSRRPVAGALLAAIAVLAGWSPGAAARNRLAREASPYLQLHADNPVDWYPWGEEALQRARRENRPIFVSIGYSTCYWCHVMEREVFSNPEIAAQMNRSFVSIKVDREERPDLDRVYMAATQALTGQGGWPNNLFLTPEGEPFFAGTYFPPTDRPGRPGFPRVLEQVARVWRDDPDRVRRVAARIAGVLGRGGPASRAGTSSVALDPAALLARARRELADQYEPLHGGFSRRVKFPRPSQLMLLLGGETGDLERLTHTLDEMAFGGIHDALGGGFHRYSTEPSWSVPHFEKMLYDNAQLLSVYARAWERTRRPLYRAVCEDIVRWLQGEMRDPEGGFYSALDAEVGHVEGASYLWTEAEIRQVLGAERAERFLAVYALTPMPTRGGDDLGRGVLRVRLPTASFEGIESQAPARASLLQRRRARPQVRRDDKVVAGWNGLAIRGLVDAGLRLDHPEWVRLAADAASFVLQRLRRPEGGLARDYIAGQVRERAVLDDYADLADGLLALHSATGDARWLEQARSLADEMLSLFQDPELGGFYLTRRNDGLLFRPQPLEDGALPSGSGVALRVLAELAARTDDPRYAEARTRAASALSEPISRAPSALASLVLALQERPQRVARGSQAPSAPTRLPRSEDRVRIEVLSGPSGASTPPSAERRRVRLHITAGWHVNANPASLPYLIPTQIENAAADAIAGVRYPPGHDFRPEFADVTLRVYSGQVTLDAPVQAPGPLYVRYQACNERSCLPPARVRIDAGLEGALSGPAPEEPGAR